MFGHNDVPFAEITTDIEMKPEKGPKLKRSWKTQDAVPKVVKKSKPIESPLILTPEQMDLLSVIKQQNNTVEEKYRCLDARDKFIRILQKRKGSQKLASKATVGVCPDMCPEKERLMRETQHQVALYEQEDGGKGMVQSLAVKQYSRSSADQETPLPHELRPVSVLQMTMGYLMHEIMDMCDETEVNLAEWYHFLWDRTRGIRKDITQQELCCQGSVELVEQCARFHIHCSARLVSEDPSVFDQKINTENLTKCLQTLKYMYHDLNLKEESCPNEPEFRAYIILLNLNDGNFMWEVQNLPEKIQKSPEVKFALEVYSALDKNNYVTFFKLVNSTTYLNACILMRYFTQIRTKAVKILIRCYTRIIKVPYPVEELTRLLAFEDDESTIDFCGYHGLRTNPNKTHIILDKSSFMLPDFPYVLDRSIKVIESKRNGTVGEVVCGKELPEQTFLNHRPENSFDIRGYLTFEKYLKEEDLNVGKIIQVIDLTDEKNESKIISKPVSMKKDDIFEKSEGFGAKTDIFAKPDPFSTKSDVFAPKSDIFKMKTGIFKTKTDIFAPKTDIFAPKTDMFAPETDVFAPKMDIFASKTDKFTPKPDIFGPKIDTNIWGNKSAIKEDEKTQKKNIFAADTVDSSNIWKKPQEKPKMGGFAFNLPTKSEEKSSEVNIFAKPKETNIFTTQSDTTAVNPFFSSGKTSFPALPSSLPQKTAFSTQKPIFPIQATAAPAQNTVFSTTAGFQPKTTVFQSVGFSLQNTGPPSVTSQSALFTQAHSPTKNIFGMPQSSTKWPFVVPKLPISPEVDKNKLLEEKLKQEAEEKRRQHEEKAKMEKLKREMELKQKELEEKRLKLLQEQLKMEEERKKEAVRKQKEMEEKRRKEAEEKERIRKEAEQKRIAEEKRIAEQKRIEKERERQRLIKLEIKTSVTKLLNDMLDSVEKKIRSEKLSIIRKNMQNRNVLKQFQKWRLIVQTNKQTRKAMDCGSGWFGIQSVEKEAKELYSKSQDMTLQFRKRYKSGVPYDLEVLDEKKINKIDLFKLTYGVLTKRSYDLGMNLQKNMFWKISVSLPDENEMLVGITKLENALDDFFKWEEKSKGKNKILIEQFKPYQSQAVTYCIEKQKGYKAETRTDSKGFIFIAEDFNTHLQKRIFEVLKGFGVFVKVPVVIILQKYDPETQVKMKSLLDENIVSNYVLLVDKFDVTSLTSLVEEGLIFLANKIENLPPLELDTLSSFITKNLCSELWKKANSFTKWNSNYKNCMKNPNIVIDLYNEGLEKLRRIIFNKSILEHIDFPEVFKEYLVSEIPDFLPCNYKYFPNFWKSKKYLDRLDNILSSLKLPHFQDNWPPIDEFELELSISKYCTKIFKKNSEKVFYRLMTVILRDIDPVDAFYKINNVLWTDVIETLSMELLNSNNLSLSNTEFVNKSIFNQYVVVYDVNHLKEYTNSDWFYINNEKINKDIKRQLKIENKTEKRKSTPKLEFSFENLDQTLSEATNKVSSRKSLDEIRKEMEEFNAMMDDLENSIKIHKKISNTFETTLKNIIDEN